METKNMWRSASDTNLDGTFKPHTWRNDTMPIDWERLEKAAKKGQKKWMGYAASPKGHFPHPTDPDKLGLPWHTNDVNPALPSDFVKPCINTAPTQYNFMNRYNEGHRTGNDVMDLQQAEMSAYIRRENKHSYQANAILDPTGNSYSKRYHIYGSTKSLGRLYFDRKNHPPKISLKKEEIEAILPKDYERKRYDFWR